MALYKAEPGKTRIGWIGTGVMGRWMCQHAISKGYKASIYNRPILVPSEAECGVVGCGMLAGCASGLFPNLETVILQQVRYDSTIFPNPTWTERYAKMQLLFDDLYASSEQFWDRFES